jgi:hypothetical protein
MDKQTEAVSLIRNLVWTGFHQEGEIAEAVSESVFHPEKMDEGWVLAQIQQAFLGKKKEETTWPEVTDYNRLERVFETLEDQNILVLENAGYTMSDGRSEITEAWYGLGAEDSDVVGYCYYHGQDLERVVDAGELWLAFGDILDDDANGITIGREIVHALNNAGFTVEWNESINTRILIKGIKWQKRANLDTPDNE